APAARPGVPQDAPAGRDDPAPAGGPEAPADAQGRPGLLDRPRRAQSAHGRPGLPRAPPAQALEDEPAGRGPLPRARHGVEPAPARDPGRHAQRAPPGGGRAASGPRAPRAGRAGAGRGRDARGRREVAEGRALPDGRRPSVRARGPQALAPLSREPPRQRRQVLAKRGCHRGSREARRAGRRRHDRRPRTGDPRRAQDGGVREVRIGRGEAGYRAPRLRARALPGAAGPQGPRGECLGERPSRRRLRLPRLSSILGSGRSRVFQSRTLRFRDWPLRWKMIVLLVAASALPLAAAAVVGVRNASEQIRRDAAEVLIARAEQLAGALDEFHRVYLTSATRLDEFPEVRGYLQADTDGREDRQAQLRTVLEIHERTDPNIRGLAVIDTQGAVL